MFYLSDIFFNYFISYVVSQFVKPKPPHQYWEEETSQSLVPENRNCLLCESTDSGACRAMPSCVYCEPSVTALCERSTPCLRCTGALGGCLYLVKAE